jgi:hydroxybutyrate-dimer hydrolase
VPPNQEEAEVKRHRLRLRCTLVGFVLVLGCGGAAAEDEDLRELGARNRVPAFLGPIARKYYDGSSDDLLTAGLGKTGLAAAAPAFANPLAPTAVELRRNAIHTNYRAVLDISAAGGYGTLYGPNVDKDGNVTASEGKIPGWDYIAYADDGSGRKNVTLMVQIPDSFDVNNACIVTATSSGSRGVYGAIGASGEWGLKRGCAVAYTDKGTGNGLHDLQADTVNLIDGTRTSAATAGRRSHFTAALTKEEQAAFNAATPNRVAYKHTHSQQNPEKDWGRNTLQAIRFAFYVLNEKYGTATGNGGKRNVLNRANTLVIASGISNGGAGALAAAEQDESDLIDGVAVTEPNAQPGDIGRLAIQQGNTRIKVIGRPLVDYFTFANLYQPCAALAPDAADAPALAFLSAANAANRCASLKAKGLLTKATLVEQAIEAQAKLIDYGWLPQSNDLQASHYRFATNAIAVTYANAYGRFSVTDNLCGFSFANTDATGSPAAQNALLQAAIFATGNGVPPTSGVNIVYNDAPGGPKLDLIAASPSTGTTDFALDGALCHRSLVTGIDAVTGKELDGKLERLSRRVQRGIEDVQFRADLDGKPAIIVHGRDDTLVPVNHSSRAYYGKNQVVEGRSTQLRYIEVTNAQHFDAFLPAGPVFAGYDSRFVPLHVYLIRALDLMYGHLKNRGPLPPSQVVRGVPRGGAPGQAPAITAANVPPIALDPDAGNRIVFQRSTLFVPD